jgi:hypothetical protein
MNCKKIIEDFLKQQGYEGLVNLNCECGCGIDDLMPCGSDNVDIEECETARKFIDENNEEKYVPFEK